MNDLLVVAVLITITLFIISELAGALLPMIIAITLVSPSDRHDLAELLAATDSSRRLRFWRAMRLAVAARRLARRNADSARRPPCACGAPVGPGDSITVTASTK